MPNVNISWMECLHQ